MTWYLAALFFVVTFVGVADTSYAEGDCRTSSCAAGTVCQMTSSPVATDLYRCIGIPKDVEVANPPSSSDEEARRNCEESCVGPGTSCHFFSNKVGRGYICVEDGLGSKQKAEQGQCGQQFENLYQKCQADVLDATNSCDEKQDPGVKSVNNQVSELAVVMGQMANSSIQAACSKMANLSQAANAAVAAYQLACSNAIGSCKASCASAINFVHQNALCLTGNEGLSANRDGSPSSLIVSVEEEIDRCNNLTANVAQANMAIRNFAGTSANASQCAALNNGTGLPPEICKTDPKNPICIKQGAVDCANPEMATNKVCVCSRNPLDPICTSAQKVGGGIGAGTGGNVDSSSRLANKADSGRYGDIPSLPEIEQGEFKSSGGSGGPDAEKVGNGGVGGGGGGGSGGGGRPSGGSGGGGNDESSKVVSGFYGGSGGSAAFGSGGNRGGVNNSGYVPGAGGVVAKGNPTPDLRKFLPGGQFDPRRMISGISGPDGITGPNSDIWQKIQNRYQVMKETLLP